MYARDTKRDISLDASPSLLLNNYSSVLNQVSAFVRTNEVTIVKNNGDIKKVAVAKSKIYQAKFLEIQRTYYLAILSNLGLQLWSIDGEHMIFYYALSSALGSELEESRFMSGVSANAKYLFAGCSSGNVLVFDATSGVGKSGFPLSQCLESEKTAILTLSNSNKLLSAGNDAGKVFIYGIDTGLELIVKLDGTGFPCTSLVQTDSILVAGYGCGRIRLYRTDIFELYCEITAHVRMVSALSLDASKEFVASCSPDQYVHVWSIPNLQSKANSNVGCVFSEHLDSAVLTGIAFIDENRLGALAYDDDKITIFMRV